MRTSKTVEQYNVGDGIVLYGWSGTVIDIDHQERENGPCTYLQVRFDRPGEVGYQYEGGWYGGLNGVVAYGYFAREEARA